MTAEAPVETELKVIEPTQIKEHVSTGDPITDLISRVAADPNASIETLERMIALRDNEQAKNAEREFNTAFALAQKNMPAIPKRGKGYSNDYALWEDVNQKIIKTLSEYGMSISYTSQFDDTAVTVTATLRHESGHSISGEFYSPIESPVNKSGKASMNKAQQRGSAMTYGKRYSTINLLSLTTYGEDDDAFAAGDSSHLVKYREIIGKAKGTEELNQIRAKLMADTSITGPDRTKAGHVWTAANKAAEALEAKAKANA